jgi:hypothetical protein
VLDFEVLVRPDKHCKASRSTKAKSRRWSSDVVFTATSSEEGHNICKTALSASVPAIWVQTFSFAMSLSEEILTC